MSRAGRSREDLEESRWQNQVPNVELPEDLVEEDYGGEMSEVKQPGNPRRSHRVNFGVPPERYGSWAEDMTQYQEAMSTQVQPTPIPKPRFHSTPIVQNQSSPGSTTSSRGRHSHVSSADSLSAKIKEEQDKLKSLEESVARQSKIVALRKELLELQLEEEEVDEGDEEEVDGGTAEYDSEDNEHESTVQQDATTPAAIYRPTPLPRKQLWKPLPTAAHAASNVPGSQRNQPGAYQQPPAAYQPNPGAYQPAQGAYQQPRAAYQPHPGAYQPAQGAYQPPPGAYQSPPRAYFRTRVMGAPTPPPVPRPRQFGVEVAAAPPPTGVEAIADALAAAIRSQSQQSEKFMARQSGSSALPVFSGNPLDWPVFAHHFRQSTLDCGFSASQNMARLEKALRGEAKQTVRALMIIPTNTDAVMERLEQRYGRPEYVVGTLVDIAKRTPTPKESKLSSFIDFANAIQNLVTTVEALQVPAYLDNPQLLQELVEKLPDSLKIQWGMKAAVFRRAGSVSLLDFRDWVSDIAEATSAVTIPKFDFKPKKSDEATFSSEEVEKRSSSGASSGGKPKPTKCIVCKKEEHALTACKEFKKMSNQEKWEMVKTKNVCFRCLRIGHGIKKCKARSSCESDGCNKRHHTLLHGEIPHVAAPPAEPRQDIVAENVGTLATLSGTSIMSIAVVTLHGSNGQQLTTNCLYDSGSTVSLLSAEVAELLGLHGAVDPLRIRWTNSKLQEDLGSQRVDFWISPYNNKDKFKLKNVRTVTPLKLPAQRTDISEIVKRHTHLQQQKFYHMGGERPVILLGQPHAHLWLSRKVIEADEYSPVLTDTKLGWVLQGPLRGEAAEESSFVCVHESTDDQLHNLLKESFSLENIGIRTTISARSSEDAQAELKMQQVTRRVGNGKRFQTGLLWKQEPVLLPSSRQIAVKRLLGLERKMKKRPELAVKIQEKITHYLTTGYARKCSPEELTIQTGKEWYLPIFDTSHPNKPGKIRLVFDAKSQSHGVCLNDYLLTGPDLLVSLPGVLLRFRQNKIAVGGDITEMFHQVRIRPVDALAQRFLWREHADDKEPSTYQLEVMMFGSVCSPYCAQYVKNANALEFKEGFPAAAAAIMKNHYMDDWLQSVDTEEEAINLAIDVKRVHQEGGFEIAKWVSNSKKFLESMGAEPTSVSKDLAEWSECPTERALGLHWIPKEDSFTFRVNLERAVTGVATGEVVPTKRAILRLVMLVWDPLGFLGNFIVKARILLQDLWRSKIGWDDQISDDQFKRWRSWISHLPKLKLLRIPRCYSDFSSKSSEVQLHIFADSSEKASCCIAYLRVLEPDGQVKVTMVTSKVRVAPVKPCSVPRLELTAALMASRLGKFIVSEMDIKIHHVQYWTDAMTVLRWLRADARRFQQFVAVRVGEIQENTDVKQWRWVPSSKNPADDATRDGKVDLSSNSRWLTGPAFLKKRPSEFPSETSNDDGEDELELRKEFVAVMTVETPCYVVPQVPSWFGYIRVVRTMAFVLRFIDIATRKKKDGHLPMERAELVLFRQSQWDSFPSEMQALKDGKSVSSKSPLYKLSPCLTEENVMKMDSRVRTGGEGIRSPIILHRSSPLVQRLLEHYHRLHHHAGEDIIRNEVRQRFWIPKLRSAVRKVGRDCMICKKKRARPQPPQMAALPEVRTRPQSRAFAVIGMDYFGPMEVTIGRRREKRYGVLFTCMTTRAVLLELASSLTTDSCVMAIMRMSVARGKPAQIFSDNGTNLRGAEKEIRTALDELEHERMTGELQVNGIEWNFIPPQSPHMGGSWERLVRSIKTAMSVILKDRAPKEEVLWTVMKEAEAVVNSRPLVDVPVDPDAPEALTPYHFLIGTSSSSTIPGDYEVDRVDLEKRWRQGQCLAEMFWKRWVREYLPTMQRRAKWHRQKPAVEVGDIVIVLDETLRRSTWPMGLVMRVFPGKDGIARVAEVKTTTGVYRRPVVKLVKLDVKAATVKRED